MNFKKELTNIIETMDGNILVIGVNEDIDSIIIKNNKIIDTTFINKPKEKKDLKNSKNILKKYKTIQIKKLKKAFKKKDINYLICKFDEVDKYLRFIIRDSVFITKKLIYLYGTTDIYILNKIIKKYKRYNIEVDVNSDKQNHIIKIYVANYKNNVLKNIWYVFIDFWSYIFDILGDGLLN